MAEGDDDRVFVGVRVVVRVEDSVRLGDLVTVLVRLEDLEIEIDFEGVLVLDTDFGGVRVAEPDSLRLEDTDTLGVGEGDGDGDADGVCDDVGDAVGENDHVRVTGERVDDFETLPVLLQEELDEAKEVTELDAVVEPEKLTDSVTTPLIDTLIEAEIDVDGRLETNADGESDCED